MGTLLSLGLIAMVVLIIRDIMSKRCPKCHQWFAMKDVSRKFHDMHEGHGRGLLMRHYRCVYCDEMVREYSRR